MRGVSSSSSVIDSVGETAPCVEAGDGLGAEHLLGGDDALGYGLDDLVVEEGVVEACVGGIGLGSAEEDGLTARPVDGGEAHGARLAACVDGAALKLEVAEFLTGGADREDLGVGGRVVILGDAIDGGGDDLACAHDDGSEGSPTAGDDVLGRQVDGHLHVVRVALHPCLTS